MYKTEIKQKTTAQYAALDVYKMQKNKKPDKELFKAIGFDKQGVLN